MIRQFMHEFVDEEILEADGRFSNSKKYKKSPGKKAMLRLSTNQRATMHEQCLCIDQRQKIIQQQLMDTVEALDNLVGEHKPMIQVRAKFSSENRCIFLGDGYI